MNRRGTLLAFSVTLISAWTLNNAVWAQAPVKAATPTAAAQSAPTTVRNANAVVTVDFPDADVVDIYHVLSDMAGWNVITDPSVKGRFSVSLKGEPLNIALDLVAKATGFSYVLVDNTLVVAPPERLSAFAKRDLVVLPVKHLSPETAKLLIEAGAPGAVVTVDAAQRIAVVSGTAEQVQQASATLQRYDTPVATEFEFVDQPVADILRTLAKSAGISVMLEGSLNTKLTIYLKDMPVLAAIDLVAARAGVQKEITDGGVLILRPAGVAKQPEAVPLVSTQVIRTKYIPISAAANLISAMYPALEVRMDNTDPYLIVKGPQADLAAAAAFVEQQDFPALRLVGVLQHETDILAVLEIAGTSHVVRVGQTVDDLVIEALTTGSITVRRGERRETITAGGAQK